MQTGGLQVPIHIKGCFETSHKRLFYNYLGGQWKNPVSITPDDWQPVT